MLKVNLFLHAGGGCGIYDDDDDYDNICWEQNNIDR